MENTVPSYMFPQLLEQIDNGDIKKQMKVFMMTHGTQGGVNPASVGFVDGDLADFYAAQAMANSNHGAFPTGAVPFMDGDVRENLQEQMLWNSIQNNGQPGSSARMQANPCLNP